MTHPDYCFPDREDEEEARASLWETYGGTPSPEDGILPGTPVAPIPADDDDLPF